MNFSYQDSDNMRRNKVTVISGGNVAYNAILSEPILTNEGSNPITLDEAKMWCSIDGNDRDAEVTLLITAARRAVERRLNRSLVNRTVKVKVRNDLGNVELPYGPVKEYVSITDNDATAIDADDYDFSSPSWSGEITVEYMAGYAHLPEDYRVMWLNKILEMFDNRGKK